MRATLTLNPSMDDTTNKKFAFSELMNGHAGSTQHLFRSKPRSPVLPSTAFNVSVRTAIAAAAAASRAGVHVQDAALGNAPPRCDPSAYSGARAGVQPKAALGESALALLAEPAEDLPAVPVLSRSRDYDLIQSTDCSDVGVQPNMAVGETGPVVDEPIYSQSVTSRMELHFDSIPSEHERRFKLRAYIADTMVLAHHKEPGKESDDGICHHIVSLLKKDGASALRPDGNLTVDFVQVSLRCARFCALELMAWEQRHRQRHLTRWTKLLLASRPSALENARRSCEKRLLMLQEELDHNDTEHIQEHVSKRRRHDGVDVSSSDDE